jgi:phage-related protein/HPt (histidine-containing phosphotransfer) domain-containing protein
MTIAFVISILVNIASLSLLSIVLLKMVAMQSETHAQQLGVARDRLDDRLRELQEALADRESSYSRLSKTVADGLMEIREDIAHNYHHTHDGHVLDRVAYLMQRMESRAATPLLYLDEDLALQVAKAGGEVIHRTMDLGQIMTFGWDMHRRARARANQLEQRFQIPCGYEQPLSRWLAKQMALFELMCGRNKALAIERLTAAVEAWKSELWSVPYVPPYVEDDRSIEGHHSARSD